MDAETLRAIATEGGWFEFRVAYAIETTAGSPDNARDRDGSGMPYMRWLDARCAETEARTGKTMPLIVELAGAAFPEFEDMIEDVVRRLTPTPAMTGEILACAQEVAAEAEWMNYDLGSFETEGQCGWEMSSPSSNVMNRKVYIAAEDDSESRTAVFTVTFEPGTMTVASAVVTLCGEDIGKRGGEATVAPTPQTTDEAVATSEPWRTVLQAVLDAWSTQFEGEQDNDPVILRARKLLNTTPPPTAAQSARLATDLADTPLEGEIYAGFAQAWDEEGLRQRLLEDLVPKARKLLATTQTVTGELP